MAKPQAKAQNERTITVTNMDYPVYFNDTWYPTGTVFKDFPVSKCKRKVVDEDASTDKVTKFKTIRALPKWATCLDLLPDDATVEDLIDGKVQSLGIGALKDRELVHPGKVGRPHSAPPIPQMGEGVARSNAAKAESTGDQSVI